VLFETVNPIPNPAAAYNGSPAYMPAIACSDRDGCRSLDLLR
jgi:hypothetical protein